MGIGRTRCAFIYLSPQEDERLEYNSYYIREYESSVRVLPDPRYFQGDGVALHSGYRH